MSFVSDEACGCKIEVSGGAWSEYLCEAHRAQDVRTCAKCSGTGKVAGSRAPWVRFCDACDATGRVAS